MHVLKGLLRGNEVEWDGQQWLASGGADARSIELVCPQCGVAHAADAPDACLGLIPGAASACCGHGRHLGYVNWPGVGVGRDWKHGAYVGPEGAN